MKQAERKHLRSHISLNLNTAFSAFHIIITSALFTTLNDTHCHCTHLGSFLIFIMRASNWCYAKGKSKNKKYSFSTQAVSLSGIYSFLFWVHYSSALLPQKKKYKAGFTLGGPCVGLFVNPTWDDLSAFSLKKHKMERKRRKLEFIDAFFKI